MGGDTVITVENPATEESCGRYAAYDAEVLDAALKAAEEAFESWSQLSMGERADWMRRLAAALEARRPEITDLLIAETGKPRSNADYDFGMLLTCLRFFSEEVQRLHTETIPDAAGLRTHQLKRHPVGVVVGFLAWNFPLLNLGYKLGPILATGCTCVIKPSEVTPLATALVGEVMRDIGFPKGVVNIVVGEDRELAGRLLTSPIPAMVTLIGSTQAGCQVMKTAATTIKRFSLELGGDAPVIVFPDYDVRQAAQSIVELKLTNTGQVCVSPNRCFVHREHLEAFMDEATRLMRGYHYGAGDGPEPLIGPVVAKEHLERLLGLLERARAGGAEVVYGGSRVPPELCPTGYYLEPTLVLCDRDNPLVQEEIFGPVLPVIPFDDADDIIGWANDSPYGLSAYVYTNRADKVEACSERLAYGSICFNEPYYSVELPHGGLKQSGFGKDCSHLSLEDYTAIKRITFRPPDSGAAVTNASDGESKEEVRA